MNLEKINLLSKSFFGSVWTIKSNKYFNNLTNESYTTFPVGLPLKYKPIPPKNLKELLIFDSVDHNATLEEFNKIYQSNLFYKSELNPQEIFIVHINEKREEFVSLLKEAKNKIFYKNLLKIDKVTNILTIKILKEINSHTEFIVCLEVIRNNLNDYFIKERIHLQCYDTILKNKIKTYHSIKVKEEIKKCFINLIRKEKINKRSNLSDIICQYSCFDKYIKLYSQLIIDCYEEIFCDYEESKSEGEI